MVAPAVLAYAVLAIVSLALQVAAAILAVRLIRVTGRRWAWALIASAILIMVVRRAIVLVVVLAGLRSVRSVPEPDLLQGVIAVIISALLLLGLYGIAPVFRGIRRTAESLDNSQARLQRLNALLRGLSNVNQLITREKRRGPLLQGVCQNLVESGGYGAAWIHLAGGGREPAAKAFAAGLPPALDAAVPDDPDEPGSPDEPPPCLNLVMTSPGAHLLGDGAAVCAGCQAARGRCASPVLVAPLTCGDRVLGLLAAAVPEGHKVVEEEEALLRETGSDIGLALHGLAMEEDRARADRRLRLDESRLEALLRLNGMTDASLQQITEFALEEAVRLTGSKIGYLKATIQFALKHPEVNGDFRAYLSSLEL